MGSTCDRQKDAIRFQEQVRPAIGQGAHRMIVAVFGPNLTADQQRKGQLHVHVERCRDAWRYRSEKPWHVDVASREEAVWAVYADHVGDFGFESVAEFKAAGGDWRLMDDLWFAPCAAALPDELALTEVVPPPAADDPATEDRTEVSAD